MALDANGTRFLLYARHLGVDFGRTAMIGRQRFQIEERDLSAGLWLFDPALDTATASRMLREGAGYSEPFFRHLGARDVHSFDATSYEGATHTHDMNLSLDDRHKERYSAVVDGGSLEHVFNFPMGLRNIMEMVEPGGHLLSLSPSNNFMGHGFYQFSPELFFRAYGEENGYRLLRMIACEPPPRGRWFSVRDPAAIRKRVGVITAQRVTLLVLAQRVEARPILARMPQQSDYSAAWESGKVGSVPPKPSSWRRRVRKGLKKGLRRFLDRSNGPFDPRLFELIDLRHEIQRRST